MNLLIAMIAPFFWGTTYAVAQFTLPDWPPLALACLRALPAGLLLLALKPTWPKQSQWLPLLFLGAVNIAVFFCLIFLMAQTLPSALAAIGMVSTPVFAMLLAFFAYKTVPSKVQIIASVIMIVAALLLFNPAQININPIGILALFAAISCMLTGSTFAKKMYGSIHWWTILVWQLILGGLCLLPIAFIQSYFDPEAYQSMLNIDLKSLLGISWIVILNTALAYGVFFWVLQKITITEMSFAGIANPIAGILMGAVLVGEQFSLFQYNLMLIMIIGSLLPQIVAAARKTALFRHRVKKQS